MLNQKITDLGIPHRFNQSSFRSRRRVVVYAVKNELVSAPNSLLIGKIQGKIAILVEIEKNKPK